MATATPVVMFAAPTPPTYPLGQCPQSGRKGAFVGAYAQHGDFFAFGHEQFYFGAMLARLAVGVAMRLRFFKPVNGWSGFLTELVIVVLGILIALAAQQAVDNLRWRGEVKDSGQLWTTSSVTILEPTATG